MCADLINLMPENLASEHLCCIIRSKKQRGCPAYSITGRCFIRESSKPSIYWMSPV